METVKVFSGYSWCVFGAKMVFGMFRSLEAR